MSRQRTGTQRTRRFRLSLSVALLLLAAGPLSGVTPASGSLDPEFTRLPFAAWAKEGKLSPIHWTVQVFPPQLSAHQRLIVRVDMTVDGRELARRIGKGRFIAMVQFEDGTHRLWQDHASLSLEDVQKGVAGSNIQISHFAFVTPGDYTLSLAVCDTATLEHNFVTRKLRVDPIKNDPLPDTWAGFPPVEFVSATGESSDIWYLPTIRNHLNLPVTTRRPVHVELIVNMTPSERASASLTSMRRNMSLLIPALKVFSGVKLSAGSIDIEVLDLSRHRIAWEQKNIRELDWPGLRSALTEENPGKIDVQSLRDHNLARQFFFDEVRRQVEIPGMVIVLSGPAFFPNQEITEAGGWPKNPNTRLIYIRNRGGSGRGGGMAGGRGPVSLPEDDMERALRPLNPRVYDSLSARQFRQILAEVLQQLSQL